MTLFRWLSAVVLLLALGASEPALATSAIFLTETEHADKSTAVVVAEVVSQRVARHPTWGRPMTYTRLRVEETLWGAAPAELEIEQFGGELDGMVTYVAGDARLAVGERAVLFLHQDPPVGDAPGLWTLTAMEQSHYEIIPSIGGDALRRELGSAYYRPDAEGRLVPYTDIEDPSATVYDLRTLLADHAAATGGPVPTLGVGTVPR